jgi:hypothetical protein
MYACTHVCMFENASKAARSGRIEPQKTPVCMCVCMYLFIYVYMCVCMYEVDSKAV